uniref:uncharacterized protein LOC117608086 isoform X2 n=1 Tax=Osmia lignaria TaxID=473952 RepID=UPI001478A308|nr:uncharacterized protein LOC117608086 isoform X2 [Osmia lignaria]
MNFHEICIPQQILSLLKSLLLEDSSDEKIKFSAIALLNLVLENIESAYDSEDSVFQLCHKAVDMMKEIVKYSDDEASVSLAAAALCAACASGTRLCIEKNDSGKAFDKVSQCKVALVKAIYGTTMSTIVPHVKDTESNGTDRVKFHRNLVTCLYNLYKLSSCNQDNLSNHLTANGYLKYFLLLTGRLPENPRRSTCLLLARIITNLADKSLSISQWPEGATAFETLMHRGLLDLPRDPQQWKNIIAEDQGGSAIALMMLIYYHFHGTRENDMICLKSLITRIINLPKSDPTPSQILKVLWFLFAVASMSHSSSSSEQDYGKAVKRLAAVLQYSRLNDCYTHHIDLLHYCLKCPEFPKDLRNKAMDLWLVESEGDIKPLLTLDCATVVRHYLLLVVQTGYSEKIIKLAMKGIREMIQLDNAKEIAEIAWHILPNLLFPYEPEKDEQVKAVLELTNISIPATLSSSVKNRCGESLVRILLRREADPKLRTLAVMQSYVLLVTSSTTKPFTILQIYCTTTNFLEELIVQGFSEDTPELSAVCLKLLAFIIHCQGKSSIQRDKLLTIDAQSLADLLLNTRKSVHWSISAMQLALEILTQNIDGSVVSLSGIPSNNDGARAVLNLYETLLIVHGNVDSTQRDIVYRCLVGVLRFCHSHTESLMYHLCNLMSNYVIVSSTLKTRHVSCHFLEFVSTWLRYRKRYCTDEAPWNPRSLRKTPFEETLDQIERYMDGAQRTDEAFHGLRYAISASLVLPGFPSCSQIDTARQDATPHTPQSHGADRNGCALRWGCLPPAGERCSGCRWGGWCSR